jgi:dihydroorotate dehydrogenase
MAGWRVAAYRAARPLLFAFDPEWIHDTTMRLLGSGAGRMLAPWAAGAPSSDAGLVELMGLRFRNRIGLGAGFDKDGRAIEGWAALGFGFVELGTVTPLPQPGNSKPRLVRLSDDAALVNRMGFNNAGADALARRIDAARPNLPRDFVVGVNIGRNRDGGLDDYAAAARTLAGVADYLALNVSSPNTPGLSDLQTPDAIGGLLNDVARAAPGRPLLVKLSPDLDDEARGALLDTVAASGAAGVILSNTTTKREGLRSKAADQEGGLSGAPLLERTLAAARSVAPRALTVVASGGIGSAVDASRVRSAGADLVQLWTGMIYAGPGLIGEVISAAA